MLISLLLFRVFFLSDVVVVAGTYCGTLLFYLLLALFAPAWPFLEHFPHHSTQRTRYTFCMKINLSSRLLDFVELLVLMAISRHILCHKICLRWPFSCQAAHRAQQVLRTNDERRAPE